jgi:hypothetical protein
MIISYQATIFNVIHRASGRSLHIMQIIINKLTGDTIVTKNVSPPMYLVPRNTFNGVKGFFGSFLVDGEEELVDLLNLEPLNMVNVENLLVLSCNLNLFEFGSSQVSDWLFQTSIESNNPSPSSDSPPKAMSLKVLPIFLTDMP